MDVSLFAFAFVGGALSFASPCVLPLVPAYLSYASGLSVAQLRDGERDRARVMLPLGAFVLGFALVFILLGASASAVFPYLLNWRTELNWLAGALIMLFGAHLLGLWRIPILARTLRWEWRPSLPASHLGRLFAAFILGISFAFGWTPCIGPILASVLVLAGQRESLAIGMGALAFYAAGLGLPFLVSGWAAQHYLTRTKSAARARLLAWSQPVAGIILLASGALIAANQLQRLGFWLLEYLPWLGQIG